MDIDRPRAIGSGVRSNGWRRLIIGVAVLLLLTLCGALLVQALKSSAPLMNLPGKIPASKKLSVVFVSSDAGLYRWSLGGKIARRLAAAGYPLVGVDSLAAFSRRRSPEQAAAIVATAMKDMLDRYPGNPIVLVGQSFGSDILVVALDRLPAPLLARIRRIVLIVPGREAYLQTSLGEMLALYPPDVNLVPLARKLPHVPITCIFGVEETNSLCAILIDPRITDVGLPGGHQLHRDSDRAFSVVLDTLQNRS
jgi:type IV secretory pathway VirJ component